MLAYPVSNLSITELTSTITECSAELTRREENIHLGFADLHDRVYASYNERGKIHAIRLFKELTCCGVKEAKFMVEAWASALNWVSNFSPEI
jgi:ribosomal protein L7/L12